MIQEINDAFVDIFTAFYEQEHARLNHQQFVAECATSLAILSKLTPELIPGPLQLSFIDYLGVPRATQLLKAMLQPFDTVPLDNRFTIPVAMVYREKRGWERDKDSVRAHEKLDKLYLDTHGPDWMAFHEAFRRTLFYPYEKAITKAFKTRVTYQFPDGMRFRGHWVVGKHGSGKTVFLANLIHADLQRVIDNQASLVVIDSQNELVPQIARLNLFAPGQPLAGKLIYIEPDPAHPLALNIFDSQASALSTLGHTDRETAVRGAMQLTQFFLSSIIGTDTTAHMDTVLAHLVPAVMSIPDATIFTLQMLVEQGYAEYAHLLKVDPEEHRWFEHRLHAPEFKQTVAALRARLDGFTADPMFRRMFKSPRSRLDLFAELQGSKVILINTNKGLLKGATEPFGRFFIAKLLQATEERMLVDKGTRLPVFCYIDEAADYIAREENITELVNKARKQLVSLTLAAQSEDDIHSATVLSALRRMAIQTTLSKPGIAHVEEDGLARDFFVPNLDLTHLPTMTGADWARTLDNMHDRYVVDPKSTSGNQKPIPHKADAPRSADQPSSGADSLDAAAEKNWE